MLGAHTYSFGSLPLAVHDRVVEGLANGAVLATIAWLVALERVPSLAELGVSYTLAPAYRGDRSVQHVRIGAALRGEAVTCLDLAIYEAARHQARGVEAWVAISRRSDDASAHAIVVFPGEPDRELDPSLGFGSEFS